MIVALRRRKPMKARTASFRKLMASAALAAAASAILLLAASCAGGPSKAEPAAAAAPAPPYIARTINLKSERVASGKIPEGGNLSLQVLLPASYDSEPDRRYPVVYCLHGYGDPPSELISAAKPALRALWPGKKAMEFIMVGIPGTNSLGGSFYVDSPATGGWRSMITDEVVPLVDSSLRTRADRLSRAIAGFSMGGFGAWSLGLARPDLFAHAWACCPGAFAPGGLDAALGQWDVSFCRAYGAAFAPDLSLERPYTDAPSAGKGSDPLYKAWYSGFGDIEGKLAAYEAGKARLQSLRFDFGEADSYAWIPAGTKYVAAAMKSAGLPVEIRGWPGLGHNPASEMIEEGLLPFLEKAFAPK